MSSVGTHDYQAARQIEITTTGDIDDLDPLGSGLIIMNNASLATIRGIKAAYHGKVITIVSVNGTGQVNLAHDNVGSLAPNRLFNYVTSGVTPLAAGVGTATYQYIGDKWKLIAHNQGAWINVPFNAGNFTASGSMTWTVDLADVQTYAFYLNGRTLLIQIYINTTTIGGTASVTLNVTLPNGYTAGKTSVNIAYTVPNGSNDEVSRLTVNAGANFIMFNRIPASNWILVTNLCYIRFTGMIEVQ